MANRSSYPDQFDTDLELPRADNGITEINGDVVNSLRDAVVAIQHALGIYPQGATESVADRLNVSLDSRGNLKTESLEGLGIATLPIYNTNIADTADIDESKLDLDYSTAYLKGRYDSLLSDLNAINTAFTTFAAEVYKHYDGTLNTHDGYQIDLVESVRGADDIETAIHELDIYMESANSSITDIYSILDTLQGLPDDIITLGNQIETHQDIIHANVVSGQARGQSGTQGNLPSSTFASTVFNTETSLASNALQVMRPNVARITGTTPKLSELATSSKEQIRIQAGGVDRSYLDVDLSTLIPATDLNDIVDQINTEARLAANHYPISAYNVSGRLVIAHNLPGDQFTIQVLSTITNSAHDVLGFEDIVDTEISWPDGYHAAGIGGKIITDMKPLLRIRYDHLSGALNEIYPAVGNLLDLFGIDTAEEARIICNIFAHDTDSTANGTYYITDVIGSGNIGLELNEDIPYGEFNIDIVADAVNFDNGSTARGEIYDVFVETAEDGYDGYGIVTKSLRAEYLTNSGVIIRGLSKEFPTSGVTWEITNNDTLQIAAGGVTGTPVSIPTNFRGQLQAYAPDNTGSALFEVIGNPSPSGAKAISPIIDFDDGPSKLYVASAHFAGDYGNNVLKFVTDRRVISDSVEEQYFDTQDPSPLEDVTSELRNNGVIRGFDLISSTTTTLKVRGGRAVVNGKIIDVDTQDVTIDSFTGDTRLLALDYNGLYKTYDNDEPGFSIAEITAGDSYGDHLRIVPIMEFGTTSTQLDGTYTDRRLIIANIDKRLLDIKNLFDTQIAQIESNIATGLFGATSVATTSFLPEYICVRTTAATTPSSDSHNPFSSGAGGTRATMASKGVTYSSNGRFNAASSGVYMISANLFIYQSSSGVLSDFDIKQNGSTIWTAAPYVNSADDPEEHSINIIATLEAGDYIEFYMDGASTYTTNLDVGSTITMIKIDSDDTNVAQITTTANSGFTYLDGAGFTGGTDTRFDLVRLNKESEFKSRGVTYINIMLEATYSDESGTSPFGTSDDVDIEIGAAITTGRLNGTTAEQYVVVRSINTTNMPANSVTEQYVVSIPLSDFSNISENILFDVRPRVRVINSIYVDGGTGGGTQPLIEFNRVRIITSGYNIAADILGQEDDGALSAIIQDRL